jgi:hypothetical protein
MRNHRDPTRSMDAVSAYRSVGVSAYRRTEIVGEASRFASS